jgi:hypothetical protein
VDVPPFDPVVRQREPAREPRAPSAADDGQAGERHRHGTAHHQEDVRILQEQAVVDGGVVTQAR